MRDIHEKGRMAMGPKHDGADTDRKMMPRNADLHGAPDKEEMVAGMHGDMEPRAAKGMEEGQQG